MIFVKLFPKVPVTSQNIFELSYLVTITFPKLLNFLGSYAKSLHFICFQHFSRSTNYFAVGEFCFSISILLLFRVIFVAQYIHWSQCWAKFQFFHPTKIWRFVENAGVWNMGPVLWIAPEWAMDILIFVSSTDPRYATRTVRFFMPLEYSLISGIFSRIFVNMADSKFLHPTHMCEITRWTIRPTYVHNSVEILFLDWVEVGLPGANIGQIPTYGARREIRPWVSYGHSDCCFTHWCEVYSSHR